MIGDALPFKSGRAYLDLGQGWLNPVLSDELVTTSFMAYCSRYEALRQKDAVLKRSSVQCENRALLLLQQRLVSEKPIGANTILAACIHFTTAAFEHQQSVDLQKLALGVRSLVDTRGGFWTFAEQVGPSILQSVLICDFLISYLYGGAPLYPDMPRPSCPPSLKQLHDTIILDPSVNRNCSPEVGVVLQDLRVLMLCRRPSKVDYGSTSATAWYPVLLLQYIDTRLAALQSRHYGTASITEVMVHCMMLARLVMLLSVRQHIQMVSNVLQRLSQALEFSRLFERISETPRLAFWVCTLVLMSEMTPVTTIDFDKTFVLTLEAVLGGERATWPDDWRKQINDILHDFLWLASVDAEFDRVFTRILDPLEIPDEEIPIQQTAPQQVQTTS